MAKSILKFLNNANKGGIKAVGENSFSGYLTTKEIDRDGEVILPNAFEKSIPQYMKNPVIFAAHMRIGANGEPTIIAKSTSVQADDYGVRFVAEYAPTELAQKWKSLIQGGFVTGISHRFIPKAWQDARENGVFIRTYTEAELLEISVEPLQSNRGAIIDAKGKGIDTELVDSLIKGIDEQESVEKEMQKTSEKTLMALGVLGKEIDTIKEKVKGLMTKDELESSLFKILGDVLDPDGAYAGMLSNPSLTGSPDHQKQGSSESDDEKSLKAIQEQLTALAGKFAAIAGTK